MTTLVTCAAGFVSQAFVKALRDKNEPVHALIRGPARAPAIPTESVFAGDVLDPNGVSQAMIGVDTVVHVPPRAYPHGSEEFQLAMHRKAHVASTRNVLEQAVHHGAQRFLLISSAHATGRSAKEILCEEDSQQPQTTYAQAKLESEELALRFAARNLIDVAIVRAPSIYGPGDRGLLSWMHRMAIANVWLPIQNLEVYHSLVFVDNLAQAGIALLEAPKSDRSYSAVIIKDNSDYRPADLYSAVCSALGKASMLFPAPISALKAMGTIGVRCSRIPKLRGLGVFRHLTTPQMYCGHRFEQILPNFPMLDLNSAVNAAFSGTSRSS